MATPKSVILAILCAALHAAPSSAGPNLLNLHVAKMSKVMSAAKGWPPLDSKCGLHDLYAEISAHAQEAVADCSVTGDLRGKRDELIQCLAECCSMQNCVGISARSSGTKLVQSFVWAHSDSSSNSYMLHEFAPAVLVAEEAVAVENAESQSSTLEVSPAMLGKRGYPPMASQCGRHDFYGEIGTMPSAVIGDCSRKGDIRDNFHQLQRCLNECCATDACIGISSTINGTKFVQSFKSAQADENSNSYILHGPTHFLMEVESSGRIEHSSDLRGWGTNAGDSGEASESEGASSSVVAQAMRDAKGWSSTDVSCGKRYDFYGGIAGKPSAELGDCHVAGNVKDDYAKLYTCLQMCCNTEKCVGITTSSSGAKLIESFAAVDEDEEANSYMQQ